MGFSGSPESAVTPIADGAARTIDVQMVPLRQSNQSPVNAATVRNGGGPVNLLNGASSTYGFAGEVPTIVRYKNASCYRMRQFAIFSDYRIPLVCERPAAIRFWRGGLWGLEFVGAWPTDTNGVENGLVFSFLDNVANIKPVSTANPGFAVYNDGGALTFAMRGGVGLQLTALAAGLVLAEWTKVRVELRHATRDADGSIRVFVNDNSVPAITKPTSDANFPLPGVGVDSVLNWGIGVAHATEYFNFRDVAVFRSPDTSLGGLP